MKEETTTMYRCENCNSEHAKQESYHTCEICGKETCSKCTIILPVGVYLNSSMEDKTYMYVFACRHCVSLIEDYGRSKYVLTEKHQKQIDDIINSEKSLILMDMRYKVKNYRENYYNGKLKKEIYNCAR